MFRRAVFAVIMLFSLVGVARAICPFPTPKACSEFFESETVFVGTPLSWGYCGPEDNEYIRYRLRVSKVLRGSAGATAIVYTPNTSIRLSLEVGKTYVIFATRRNGRLEASDDCGPLTEPGAVSETMRQIEDLESETTASIEGQVVCREPNDRGVGGVTVRILGEGQSYEAISDAQGSFRVPVPPGHYEVMVDSTLKQSDYNWYDLTDIRLVRGQCAQLLFVPRQPQVGGPTCP